MRESKTRRWRRASLAVAAAWAAAMWGCGEASSSTTVAAPEWLVPLAFSFDGVPGPWWRAGAARPDFDTDLRACRDRSTAARDAAAPGERLDRAYREFLDCMDELAWKRGYPPPRPPQSAS